jgi:thiol-disulfide isomerase/thioredoxin
VAKPIVDGIEKDLTDRVEVIRLDVWSDIGRVAAQRYGVRGIPTLLVLDGAGEVQDVQVGVPDRKHTVDVASKLLLDD